jgi:hypothetical protein
MIAKSSPESEHVIISQENGMAFHIMRVASIVDWSKPLAGNRGHEPAFDSRGCPYHTWLDGFL